MSRSAVPASVRGLRHLLIEQRRQEERDEQLLHAFLARSDETAFAALVRRHGPMVMSVCQRVLGHVQDAEDAYQATFLLLARKAVVLRNRAALASWLHGTAYRTALKAKQSAARRRKHEARTPPRTADNPSGELLWREVQTLLDEEIALLPEIYRSVFVLCCLESLSRAETARRLGLKEGTISSRLAEARKRLQQRLARRGVELTALLAATALTTQAASALPPVPLTRMSGTALSPTVSALADSGSSIGSLGKAKLAAALVLIASVLSGAGLWAFREPAAPQVEPAKSPAVPSSDKPQTAAPKREAAQTVEVQGRVRGPDGKPKAGAKLLLLGSKGNVKQLGIAAEDGRFTVAVSKETTKHWDHWLVAQADGTGLDFLDLYQLKPGKPIELRLVKDNPIRGRVVNTEGKPIRGVRVAAEQIEIYHNNSLDTFRAAWIKLWAGGAGTGLDRQIHSGADALFVATTDADGRFILQGMGSERTIRLRLRGSGIADTSVWVANRAGLDPKLFNKVVLDRINADLKGHMNYRWDILSGPDVSVVAEAEKVIRGVVTDVDTGKAQPGIIVRLPRDSDELIHFPPEAKTDAQGRYEIHGVRKTKRYLLAVAGNEDTGHMPTQVWAEDTIAHQPVRADIKVKKGVVITGKIIDGATGDALPGFIMAVVLRGNPFAKDYPRFDEFHGLGQWNSSDRTDANHAFRVVAVPGPILLMGKTEGTDRAVYKATGHDAKYPQYFSEDGDGYYGYDHMAPLQGIWNKVLEIKPGVAVVKQDIVLERENILAVVRIQDAKGQPLPGAWAETNEPKCGVSFAPHGGRLESSSCSVYGEAPGKPLRIVFYQANRKLIGSLMLKGDEKPPMVVKLGPAGVIKGRLLDAEGKPLAGLVVDLRYRDRAAERIHHDIQFHEGRGQIVTDAAGTFTFDEVVPELKFELWFHRDKQRFERVSKPAEATIEVKPGKTHDVGAIELKPSAEKPES